MVYNVIQWGTGGVGKYSLREVLRNPEFKLVGVKAFSAGKAGLDAGDLCGLPRTGVLATDEVGRLPPIEVLVGGALFPLMRPVGVILFECIRGPREPVVVTGTENAGGPGPWGAR